MNQMKMLLHIIFLLEFARAPGTFELRLDIAFVLDVPFQVPTPLVTATTH